jgi:hypothetical protein
VVISKFYIALLGAFSISAGIIGYYLYIDLTEKFSEVTKLNVVLEKSLNEVSELKAQLNLLRKNQDELFLMSKSNSEIVTQIVSDTSEKITTSTATLASTSFLTDDVKYLLVKSALIVLGVAAVGGLCYYSTVYVSSIVTKSIIGPSAIGLNNLGMHAINYFTGRTSVIKEWSYIDPLNNVIRVRFLETNNTCEVLIKRPSDNCFMHLETLLKSNNDLIAKTTCENITLIEKLSQALENTPIIDVASTGLTSLMSSSVSSGNTDSFLGRVSDNVIEKIADNPDVLPSVIDSIAYSEAIFEQLCK